MVEYTYFCQDLVTGEPLADLPLSVATSGLPRTISSDASTTFTLDIGDRRIRALDPTSATRPGRTSLFVLRDGQPVWAGIIWGRTYKAATTTLTLNVSTVESYWRHRFWAVTRKYVNADQLAIAAGMWLGVRPVNGTTTWQRTDGGSTVDADPLNGETDSDGVIVPINVLPYNIRSKASYVPDTINSGVAATVARTITYDPGKNVYDAITELAELDLGFEWTCDPALFSDGTLGWNLRYAYPKLGRTDDVTGVSFDYQQGVYGENGGYTPGAGSNILDYELSEDATASANHSIVTGQEASGQIAYHVTGHLPSLREGYPLLEIGPSYADAEDVNVAAKSIGDLAAAALPNTITSWTVRADGDFGFGSLQMGDQAVFAVSDLFTPRQSSGDAGRYSVERVVGWALQPEQRDQPERWQLTTNPVEQASARLPRSEARRLERIERSLSATAKSSRVAQTKTYGWTASTASVQLAQPSTSSPGAWTDISEVSFVRQGDWLTLYHHQAAFTSNPNPINFQVRIVDDAGAILSSAGVYNATGAPTAAYWWDQYSLDLYNYGEIVNGTIQARVMADTSFNATFNSYFVRVLYVVTGLPYHD